MKKYFKLSAVFFIILYIFLPLWVPLVWCRAGADTAKDILKAAGIKGGLIIHLGCGDGKLTANLRVNDTIIVQGLDSSEKNVEKARKHIRSLGLYGDLSVNKLDGLHLPYADNLVNLVVAENPGKISKEEIMRVLCPGGLAYIKEKNKWEKRVKQWPEEIDSEWSHYLHGPDNNQVANDTVVGPPRQMQWAAKPLWLRSHEINSGINAMVTSEGRIFYTFDEGPIGIGDPRIPSKWSLIARDAFNGIFLWKVPIPSWGWEMWHKSSLKTKEWNMVRGRRTGAPSHLKNLLVADKKHVYFTLGYNKPISVIDALSGKILRVLKDTEKAKALRLKDGILIVVNKSLIAFKGDTGKKLWKRSNVKKSDSVAIHNKHIYYVKESKLVCLDFQSGKEVWKKDIQINPDSNPGNSKDKKKKKRKNSDIKRRDSNITVAYKKVILLSGPGGTQAFSAATGKRLWKNKAKTGKKNKGDIFIINNTMWMGYDGIGYDLQTGKIEKEIEAENLWSMQHHHRCYGNKATSKYIISAMEGMEYMDLEKGEHSRNNWLRGVCAFGIMPANGMVYVPTDQCFCQPGVKLLGFTALNPAGNFTGHKIKERLTKGPAYKDIQKLKDRSAKTDPDDWPIFRHDILRSGASKTSVKPKVKELWKIKLGGKLSQPVVADNRLFISSIDSHTVHAIDAKSGKQLWSYTAGGRVDSPPAVYKGLVIFGSVDGRVYCLRGSDGKLAWKFHAAPQEKLVSVYNQVESAWPVYGSVLIKDNIVYLSAGRSTFLDGGIYLYGLDPITGKVIYESKEEGPYADLSKDSGHSYWQEGARNDILVSDGTDIYIMQLKFNKKLEIQKLPTETLLGDRKFGRHIFSTAGFLDDEGYNRTFWMYTESWPGFYLANQASKSGQLLVFDEKFTYGVRAFWTRNRHSPMFFPGKRGYILFADDNDNEPGLVGVKSGWRPVEWLPEFNMYKKNKKKENTFDDRISGAPGYSKVDAVTKNKDKGIGFTRPKPPKWMEYLPIMIKAMVKTDKTLFIAGPPDIFDEDDPMAVFEDRKGGLLWALSPSSGKKLSELKLKSPPVFDGLIAAKGKLFIALKNGELVCFGQ